MPIMINVIWSCICIMTKTYKKLSSENRQQYDQIQKLKMKLKMMEISFEQINNSRNDLMRQLAEAEKKIEDGKQS